MGPELDGSPTSETEQQHPSRWQSPHSAPIAARDPWAMSPDVSPLLGDDPAVASTLGEQIEALRADLARRQGEATERTRVALAELEARTQGRALTRNERRRISRYRSRLATAPDIESGDRP